MKEGGVLTGLSVFHFAGAKLRDGRPLPKAGDTLLHDGDVRPCESGLHGSVRALDALSYAPGWRVALCELRGELVQHGDDKHAASERFYLTGYVDAREVVQKWAFAEADRAVRVHAVAALRSAASADGMPDEYRDVLKAKADDLERLPVVDSASAASAANAARNAAESAAWSAARSAESAAWSTAESAESAVWSAAYSAESAVWSAAASAARSAAWSAARSAESAAWSAAASAESAAWSAARNAAESAANERLEFALYNLLWVTP